MALRNSSKQKAEWVTCQPAIREFILVWASERKFSQSRSPGPVVKSINLRICLLTRSSAGKKAQELCSTNFPKFRTRNEPSPPPFPRLFPSRPRQFGNGRTYYSALEMEAAASSRLVHRKRFDFAGPVCGRRS